MTRTLVGMALGSLVLCAASSARSENIPCPAEDWDYDSFSNHAETKDIKRCIKTLEQWDKLMGEWEINRGKPYFHFHDSTQGIDLYWRRSEEVRWSTFEQMGYSSITVPIETSRIDSIRKGETVFNLKNIRDRISFLGDFATAMEKELEEVKMAYNAMVQNLDGLSDSEVLELSKLRGDLKESKETIRKAKRISSLWPQVHKDYMRALRESMKEDTQIQALPTLNRLKKRPISFDSI